LTQFNDNSAKCDIWQLPKFQKLQTAFRTDSYATAAAYYYY